MATEADLTPQLLTNLLAPHTGGATVTSATAEAVGTGQMASCLRLHLDYAGDDVGPATVLAKLPSLDPTSQAAAQALRLYEVEVNFYQELQPRLSVRTPAVYHAEVGADTVDFLLLLEDVSPARAGDQLKGCGPDEAARAVAELAHLHAPLWGDGGLEELEWLHRNTEDTRGQLPEMVRMLFPGFKERYADRIEAPILAVAEQLVAGIDTYDATKPGPWTVIHGDFRLDNLLFSPAGPDAPVYVVDWQTAVLGPGISDLSYFVGASFEPKDRRAHEEDLVRLYRDHLAASGVDLAWDDVWTQYRRYTFAGLIMAIAASMLVQQTERGDDMFMAMVERHGQHAIDLRSAGVAL